MKRRVSGFTLVETMVAMVITGLIAATVGRIAHAVILSDQRLRLSRVEWDGRWAAYRWLHEAFVGLEVGTDSLSSFQGWADSVRFSANMRSASGEVVLSRPNLVVRGQSLVAEVGSGLPDTLVRGVSRVAFGYLQSPGARAEWLIGWHSPATAPIAVRLILWGVSGGADTLLLPIGRRG